MQSKLPTVDANRDLGRSNQPATTVSSHSTGSVSSMVVELSTTLEAAIEEIHSVNAETKVLALNARIEAARAGTYGAAFSVVAAEMQKLSDRTSAIAQDMASRTRDKTNELMTMIGSSVRGTRLSDLALTNIDLMDRCLYERTCDVRWWATDKSIIDALLLKSPDSIDFASRRMGVILGAYTVYYDLVLCDLMGKVIANGKPTLFRSTNKDESRSTWFNEAMRTQTSEEYGFQTAHISSLVDNRPSLIYSCAIREEAATHGKPIGALGIIFNWDGLSKPILEGLPVAANEKASTIAHIVDKEGSILASNQHSRVGTKLTRVDFDKITSEKKGYFTDQFDGRFSCVGYASSPGFETYKTGWYSVIAQSAE